MENFNTGTYDMYKDISARTNGEIYIGVIGAVRTGKSSFIKRFMELMVLPFMEDENSRQQSRSLFQKMLQKSGWAKIPK